VAAILEALGLYADWRGQQLIGKSLLCGRPDAVAPGEEREALRLSYLRAEGQIVCGSEPSQQSWLRGASSFLKRLATSTCRQISAADMVIKDKYIDTLVKRLVLANGVNTAAQAYLVRQLLEFTATARRCDFGRSEVSAAQITSSPFRTFYLRHNHLALPPLPPLNNSGAEVRSLAELYSSWLTDTAHSTEAIQSFCDHYDPNWRTVVQRRRALDLANLPPGCSTFEPESQSGEIVLPRNAAYGAFGSIIFLKGNAFRTAGEGVAGSLFVNVQRIDPGTSYNVISFPVFLGTSRSGVEQVDELISFHFLARPDMELARRRVLSSEISGSAAEWVLPARQDFALKLAQVLGNDTSHIDEEKVALLINGSVSGLLGLPWRHLTSRADVCEIVRAAGEQNKTIRAFGAWRHMLDDEDKDDQEAFCGSEDGTKCLQMVLKSLECGRDSGFAGLVINERGYFVNVTRMLMK